ncbi:MAG: hypothetical protein E7Z91_04930 [Cyanobacteria bacterium SIG30]|nr:hypothetical protein [Cyanobacteria bacterium SIG30]
MKKVIALVLIFFITTLAVNAQNISLIYINGSNNNNEKMKNWFMNGIEKKLHPSIIKKIKNEKKKNLTLNKYSINEKPVIFFWGDKSKTDLEFVERQLDFSNDFNALGSAIARTLIAKYMHDAIWVQKTHNMLPILDELNEMVKAEWQKGNKSVLMGYSAGNFVNYEYLFNKIPYINIEGIFKYLNVDNEVINYVLKNPRKNTCMSAIRYGNMGTVTTAGHLILDKNNQNLIKNYSKIDEVTEKYCAPEGAILGTIGFANPLILFYSDLGDPDYEINFYNKYLLKYMIENGMFKITANFKEDPLGFTTGDTLTYREIENLLGYKFENPTGFIYSKSYWSGRIFTVAHTSYWSGHRRFANMLSKTLYDGYKFQHDKDFQQKMLKKRNKVNKN